MNAVSLMYCPAKARAAIEDMGDRNPEVMVVVGQLFWAYAQHFYGSGEIADWWFTTWKTIERKSGIDRNTVKRLIKKLEDNGHCELNTKLTTIPNSVQKSGQRKPTLALKFLCFWDVFTPVDVSMQMFNGKSFDTWLNTDTDPEVEVRSSEVEVPEEEEHRELGRDFYRKIEQTFNDEIIFQWKGHQCKRMAEQVKRLGEEKVFDVIRGAAHAISSPGITDRAQYLLRIVEKYDPVVEEQRDQHFGNVTCPDCKTKHKILMEKNKRRHYWAARGEQLAIRCGCGATIPTGKRMPASYDVDTLKDMPSPVGGALES